MNEHVSGDVASNTTYVKQAYHHKDLRNALIDEALAILASEGSGELTLRGLARRLGVTHTAPYAHFADKKALLVAVADEGFERLKEALKGARDSTADLHERFVAQGLAYVRFARENPNLYRLMFVDPVLSKEPDCVVGGDDAFGILLETVSSLGISSETEIAYIGVAVWASVHGVAMLEIDERLQHTIADHSGGFAPKSAALPDGNDIVRLLSHTLLRGLQAVP